MLMKNFVKVSLSLSVLISLFSCGDDLTIEPWAENVDSSFYAEIDNGGITPDTISAKPDAYTTEIEYDFNNEDNEVIESGSFEAIRVLGSRDDNKMAIIFPAYVVEGTYSFSDTQGRYLANNMSTTSDGTATNRAKSGVLTIILHNSTAHYVEGYFDFDTDSESVSNGYFRTFYTVE